MMSATAYTKNIICEDPLVYTIDDVLTPEECDRFIELAKPTLTPSLVSTSNKGVTSNGRTSTNTWLLHDTDDVTKLIGERIAGIVEIPLANSEKYQVVHYDISQEYRQHYDSWEHNGSEKTLRCMKFGGARLLTALVYLCDVEAGGGTRMTKLGHTVSAKRGRLLVFENTYQGTNQRHELAEHAGMPVGAGEKYIFNMWFKECKSSMLYSEFNPQYYETAAPVDNISLKVEEAMDTETAGNAQEAVDAEEAAGDCVVLNEDKEQV
jgi:prolyl 4-hydroxylase